MCCSIYSNPIKYKTPSSITHYANICIHYAHFQPIGLLTIQSMAQQNRQHESTGGHADLSHTHTRGYLWRSGWIATTRVLGEDHQELSKGLDHQQTHCRGWIRKDGRVHEKRSEWIQHIHVLVLCCSTEKGVQWAHHSVWRRGWLWYCTYTHILIIKNHLKTTKSISTRLGCVC